MSIALLTAVTGLQAHQQRLDVIANNIANVNTTGFRSARVQFEDLFSQTLEGPLAPLSGSGGTNPKQVGLGVRTGSIDTNFGQAALLTTGVNSDLAIQGDGFFILRSADGTQSYTRDGSFALNTEGLLVEPATGQVVQGYVADSTGAIDTTADIEDLQIPLGTQSNVRATTEAVFTGNLDADTDAGNVFERVIRVYDSLGGARDLRVRFVKEPEANTWMWRVASGGTADFFGNLNTAASVGDSVETSLRITDSAGTPRAIRVTLTKTGANQWSWEADSQDSDFVPPGPSGTITFNASGEVTSPAGPVTATLNYSGGVTASADFDLTALRESANASTLTAYNPPSSPDPDIASVVGTGTLVFSSDGEIASGGTGTVSVNFASGSPSAPTTPLSFTMDFSQASQFSGDTALALHSQDGYPQGVLESYAFGQDGLITGVFTNGLTRTLGQIALATFPNNGGLVRVGDNQFQESPNSGLAQIGAPNTGSRGQVSGGVLEGSNVDLGTEFSNLIVTQRGFQANARTVTAADTLLQETVNLIR